MIYFLLVAFPAMCCYRVATGVRLVNGPMANWRLVKRIGKWFHK